MSKETAPKSGPGIGEGNPSTERVPGQDGKATPSVAPTSSPPRSSAAGAQSSAATTTATPARPKTSSNGSSTEVKPGPTLSDGTKPLLGVAGLPISQPAPTTGEYLAMARSRRRAWLRVGIVGLLALLILNVMFLGPFTDPAATVTPRVPDAVPLSEVQPYGVNTFLHKEVESWKKDQTLAMAKDLGVGWIKQQFPWAEIEYRTDPSNPFWDVKNNQNAWAKYDGIVALAQRYNLRIIARIDSAPPWSHPNNPDAKAPPDAEHMVDFGNFVNTFVSRYKGTVSAIQVWNEPNLQNEWGGVGHPANAVEYTTLLKTAYDSAKQADHDMIVLAAPLATTNESLAYAGNLKETDYLQEMYDAGAKPYFDAMAANAYGTEFAPEDEPSPGKFNFRRVEYLRQVMEKNGDSKKSVWFNEYGWNASPDAITDRPWGNVTPDQQAEYTVRGINYAREHWPWAGVFTIWYLRQVGDTPRTQSEYWFGMVDPDFVAQPVYREVQTAALSTDKVATPGEWGPLSAAVQAPPQWQIRLDSTVPGGMFISPMSVGSALDVTFLGNDAKVTLVPAAGKDNEQVQAARYYVTIDGNSDKVAQELPRDAGGQAYIDVQAGDKSTTVVLAHGINPEMRTSQHSLEIKVAGDPSGVQEGLGGRAYAPVVQRPDLPGIGTITVESHRSYILFTVLTLLLLAAILFALWVLRRSSRGPVLGG